MKNPTIVLLIVTLALIAAGWIAPGSTRAASPEIVTIDTPSPLLEIRIQVKTGSAFDPPGMEGLAAITAEALLEGGFGDADSPVSKEDLARMTRAWGEGARPRVSVAKEATTFELTVPKSVLDEYIEEVLSPLFSAPLFAQDELDRLVNEATTNLTGFLRYEAIEMLGLEALDNYVFDGTSYGHTVGGTVQGLKAITRKDVAGFYAKYYRPAQMIVGISSVDGDVAAALKTALQESGAAKLDTRRLDEPVRQAPAPVVGREVTIVALPDAGATGVHIAYPIEVRRTDPDFWPLYVANVYFGTHRDSHGHLYNQIRRERGYNYGDYSYVEHFARRPRNLFPPFNTPREHQYFSMWIRPVDTDYAHHLLKAAVWELENVLREGVPAEEVERSKNKAKVLYLNLAETSARLLECKVDDAFYGMDPGYLEAYLERIDAVTPEQVNAALQKYLQADNLKILIVTEADRAEGLAEDIRQDRNRTGKQITDYQVNEREADGETVFDLPASRLATIQRDAVWTNHWLGLDPTRITVVPVEAIFESGAFITDIEQDGNAR